MKDLNKITVNGWFDLFIVEQKNWNKIMEWLGVINEVHLTRNLFPNLMGKKSFSLTRKACAAELSSKAVWSNP